MPYDENYGGPKNKSSKFVTALVCVYVLTVVVAVVYFNRIYINQYGFDRWLDYGAIVPTLKGFAWPYFIFFK